MSISTAYPVYSLMSVPRYTDVFFSRRRRHTRLQGDWSSDVCSSDLSSVEHESDHHIWSDLAYCREKVGREKPNVRPIVNCQSGAARLMPRRIPASRKTFFDVGCQITPRSAELFGHWSCVLSPLTSPTSRSLGCTGSSPITPQMANACRSSRSRPPPPLTCTVTAATFPLTIPIASNPTPCS